MLGASVLRHREVLFDIPQGTISFVDAECERATPANAVLRGAFAFAPCSSSGGGGNETLEQGAPARQLLHDQQLELRLVVGAPLHERAASGPDAR